MNEYSVSPWVAIVWLVSAVALLAGIIWCNWQLIHLRHQVKGLRGNIRVLASDKHQQIKAANAVIAQVLTLSNLSIIPRLYRLPVTMGIKLLQPKRRYK